MEKKLQEFNVNKSCGPDGLHSKLLKTLFKELSVPLSIIMESSLKHMCKLKKK